MKIQPSVIFSESNDELGASLTFHTERSFSKGKIRTHLPIIDIFGNKFDDAEAAFQFYKGEVKPNRLAILVMRIASAKFKQHPELLVKVYKKGGNRWLDKCTYINERSQLDWQGVGQHSFFIRCISYAYKRLEEALDINNLDTLPY